MQTIALATEQLRRGGQVLITDGGARGWLMSLDAQGQPLPTAEPEPAIIAMLGLLDLGGLAHSPVRLQPLSDPESLAACKVVPRLSLADLTQYHQRSVNQIELVAVADMPTPHSDTPFRAHSFVNRLDGVEHLALVTPGTPKGAPLVRLHSECLTGDAFGSLRCDCGPQLQESLRRLAQSPGGVLLYIRGHEGRGIGLANKMRAYALQDQGMDTAEANSALGLPQDARDYAQAAQMLRALGHASIRLLSNNPDKVSALRHHGIAVLGVEPLIIAPNPFNSRYLATKAHKFRHALPM